MKIIVKIPFFKKFSLEFKRELALKLEEQFYGPEQYIIEQ